MSPDKILVIGGGPAGLEAARGIAELGYKAILVEKRDRLGGTPDEAQYAALTPDLRSADEALQDMITPVSSNPNVEVMLNTIVTGSSGDSAAEFQCVRSRIACSVVLVVPTRRIICASFSSGWLRTSQRIAFGRSCRRDSGV